MTELIGGPGAIRTPDPQIRSLQETQGDQAAVGSHAGTHRPYRPSNGTEGDYFMAEWCSNCALADFDGDGCMINLRAYAFNINEPEYPAEWNYTNGGVPQCTAFSAELPPEPRCEKTVDMFDGLLDGREHNDMPGVM